MRNVAFATCALFLAACSTSNGLSGFRDGPQAQSPVSQASNSASVPVATKKNASTDAVEPTRSQLAVVETFIQVCQQQLGDVDGSKSAAQNRGFNMSDLNSNAFMGFNKAIDQSVQLNMFTQHSYECAVTTSAVPNWRAVRKSFFESVGLKANSRVASTEINGQTYTYKFDTQGGLALVVFKP